MLKRFWKKLKGSDIENREVGRCDFKEETQTEPEGSPVSDPGCQSEDNPASPEVKPKSVSKRIVQDVVFMPNQDDFKVGQADDASVSSESCASSSSSSDDYYAMVETEMKASPTRRSKQRYLSEPTAENSGESPTKLKGESPEKPKFDLKLMGMTHFPDFELDSIPDGELTDGSDDDSTVRKKEEAYATKEDQDVAVFMDIAKRLAMKSLLHLLQGHVRAQQNLPSSYLQEYKHALTAEGEEAKSKPSVLRNLQNHQKKPIAKKKHFRWAEVTDSKVRVVVHEVENVKDCKEMWWPPAEMNAIRKELIDVVQFFRRRRPNYVQSVEIVARGNQEERVLEDHMKQLMADSFPRGLETHIVKMLSDHRKSAIQAVLEEQRECKSSNDTPECAAHCIREQSLAYSQMNSRFAFSMAKCDEIDALKAGMSRWRGTPASEGFFSL